MGRWPRLWSGCSRCRRASSGRSDPRARLGAQPFQRGSQRRADAQALCRSRGTAKSRVKAREFWASTALTYLPVVPILTGFCNSKELAPIRRPMRAPAPVQKDGPRINEDIRVREVHLIDKDGHNLGNCHSRTLWPRPRRPASIWSRFRPTPRRRSARSWITASTSTRSRRSRPRPARSRRSSRSRKSNSGR